MFEAERLMLEDSPIIPLYTYVTKRLVDQHVKGWQNSVMDHHPSRHMYKLRSRQTPSPTQASSAAAKTPAELPE